MFKKLPRSITAATPLWLAAIGLASWAAVATQTSRAEAGNSSGPKTPQLLEKDLSAEQLTKYNFRASKSEKSMSDLFPIPTDEELKAKLTPEQYQVCLRKGTERAFSGEYWDNHAVGTYLCRVCELPLFTSDTKFESGTGWPSFFQPIDPEHIKDVRDISHGMIREETVCANCGSHLGHVFNDGPKPTGLRYCMNSASLRFVESGSEKAE